MTRDVGGRPDDSRRIVVPSPDPTVLTTSSQQREILALRELLEARIIGMERDIARLQGAVDKAPDTIEKMIHALEALHNEKFRGIQTQFVERDIRTEQTARDSKVAVDAALQAAKEAVAEQNRSSALAIAKSEGATTKQIDQQGTLIQTTTGGLNDKIEDLKLRLGSLKDDVMQEILTLRESMSRGMGAENQAALSKANVQYLVMMAIAAAGVLVAWMVVKN